MPTSFYITGSRGISSFTPGNFTGNPSVAGPTGTTSGVQTTVAVGSGSDDASVFSAPPVTRNTVANGTPNAVLAYIGNPASSSGSGSAVLPAGQSYRDSAPVPPAPALGMQIPGSPANPTGSTSTLPNPLNSMFGGQNRMPSIGGMSVSSPATMGGVYSSGSMMSSSGGMFPASNN